MPKPPRPLASEVLRHNLLILVGLPSPILPQAIILTKAHIMAKGCIVASEVFLVFTTQLFQHFSPFLLFALFSDEPKVLLSKYSRTAILHAAHFRRVVKNC